MPIAIGIAGGTGSGKTALARALHAHAPDLVSIVELDWYYRDQAQLSLEEREHTNYDAPGALELDRVNEDVRALLAGTPVEAPIYDFASHTRIGATRNVSPLPIIAVEGILALSHAPLRALFHTSVFVDTPADLRLARRLGRDLAERGRTAESVLRQYLGQARPMHERWVEPAKRYAQWVLPGDGPLDRQVAAIWECLSTALGC